MRIHHLPGWWVVPLLILLLPISSRATTDPPDPTAGTAPTSTVHRSELTLDLETIFTREREQLAELYREFAAATDEETALAVQRRIVDVRRTTEIALLEAQLGHARRAGRAELATAIEIEIAERRERMRTEGSAPPAAER